LTLSLRTLPRFLLTVVMTVLATLFLAPPLILVSLLTASGTPTYVMMRWWAMMVTKGMGLTFSLHGAERFVPGTSYIITPNHQSNADILALVLTLPMPFRWVIKKELLKIPLFGWALASTGAIALDRTDKSQAVKSLREGAGKLRNGWSVLIYPEGTRSSDGRLQAFKKGAFMLAVQTGITILPVTCNGAFRVMPKKSLMIRPGHITVTVGEPVPCQEKTETDVPELMEKTRREIEKNFDEDYDPFAPRKVMTS
jgi:1-acyl-sn-glycerol-3-phosphate acyltransferase